MSQFSMIDLNKVMLAGRLTQDPELRYIPSGTAVATLRLAINRQYTTGEGEKKEEVTFINAVVWDKQAEFCAQHLSKGRPVFVEGRLVSRSWETSDGQKRSILEVRAQRVQFMDFVSREESAIEPSKGASAPTPPAEGTTDEEIPF